VDSTKEIIYARVRIAGRLICESALHVGDGAALPFQKRDCTKAKKTKGDYNSVCIAADGKPYLPASTLRGSLREVTGRSDPPAMHRLFGFAEDDQGQCGAVRVYDAFLAASPNQPAVPGYWSAARATTIRHGVAIDPVTGTAEERKLFRYEYLPAGSIFNLELEADRLTEDELARLLGVMECWDGSAAASVGKGTSKGQGRLKWCLDKVEVLDAASLEQWLASDKPLGEHFRVLQSLPSPRRASSLPLQGVWLYIIPSSPLLVNDPDFVRDEKGAPKHEYSRLPDGQAMIPAASLRGLIRARARRILATLGVLHEMSPAEAGAKVQQLVAMLFGKTGARSPLWVNDAIACRLGPPHSQTFNAVDRFTGGVQDTKLIWSGSASLRAIGGRGC
jgi:CRISPR/Cas system CSM-associated protein Csm3 (group 7 of RAMP superfamily)